MKTRSQTKKENLEFNRVEDVNIDFDAASEAWMANKKSIGNGQYKYICIFSTSANKNGVICGKSCYKELSYCWQHRNSGLK